MKKFVSGLIIGSIITTSISALAGGVWDKIDVLKNDINIMVNGKQIFSDNFLYNDTTYLPLRTIAEELGQKVTYDEATNTAHIGSVPENNVVAGGGVSNIPDTLWIEVDEHNRVTNDEFRIPVYIVMLKDESRCYAIDIYKITNKLSEVAGQSKTGFRSRYILNSNTIYDLDTNQTVVEFNSGIDKEGYISLECYYSTIYPWMKNIN